MLPGSASSRPRSFRARSRSWSPPALLDIGVGHSRTCSGVPPWANDPRCGLVPSCAVGVVQSCTAVRRFSVPSELAACPGPEVASMLVGVGHCRGVVEFPATAASVKLTPACALLPARFLLLDAASPAVGVGHSWT